MSFYDTSATSVRTTEAAERVLREFSVWGRCRGNWQFSNRETTFTVDHVFHIIANFVCGGDLEEMIDFKSKKQRSQGLKTFFQIVAI